MLAEKGLDTSVEPADPGALSGIVRAATPHGELPLMIDRDLALHGAGVIIDYLDERYPHPPFMPMDPVSRARTRLAAHRIEREWYALVPSAADSPDVRESRSAKLRDELADSDEVFGVMPFFLSQSFSVLDAMLVPLLWRLPHYGIVLPETATSIASYSRRMFARPAFRASLGPPEKEMAR